MVGKGENAGNHHFLLFPQCSVSQPEITILVMLKFSSANAKISLDQSKILSFGNELKVRPAASGVHYPKYKSRTVSTGQ